VDVSACSTVYRRKAGNRLLFRKSVLDRMRPTCSRTASLSVAVLGIQVEGCESFSESAGAG
jgi:hypothetical protein